MEIVLKPDEVASVLRTDLSVVIDLLDTGKLAGFKVGNEWRVLGAELIRFLTEQMQNEQLEILGRRLSDPSEWAEELSKHPDFLREIQSQDFEDGTFGAFLKDGLKQRDALRKAKDILKSKPPPTSDGQKI